MGCLCLEESGWLPDSKAMESFRSLNAILSLLVPDLLFAIQPLTIPPFAMPL